MRFINRSDKTEHKPLQWTFAILNILFDLCYNCKIAPMISIKLNDQFNVLKIKLKQQIGTDITFKIVCFLIKLI